MALVLEPWESPDEAPVEIILPQGQLTLGRQWMSEYGGMKADSRLQYISRNHLLIENSTGRNEVKITPLGSTEVVRLNAVPLSRGKTRAMKVGDRLSLLGAEVGYELKRRERVGKAAPQEIKTVDDMIGARPQGNKNGSRSSSSRSASEQPRRSQSVPASEDVSSMRSDFTPNSGRVPPSPDPPPPYSLDDAKISQQIDTFEDIDADAKDEATTERRATLEQLKVRLDQQRLSRKYNKWKDKLSRSGGNLGVIIEGEGYGGGASLESAAGEEPGSLESASKLLIGEHVIHCGFLERQSRAGKWIRRHLALHPFGVGEEAEILLCEYADDTHSDLRSAIKVKSIADILVVNDSNLFTIVLPEAQHKFKAGTPEESVGWCKTIAQFSQGGVLADNVEVQLGGPAEEEASFGFFFCCTPPARPSSGVQNEDWGITEMWGRTFGFGDGPAVSRGRSPGSRRSHSMPPEATQRE